MQHLALPHPVLFSRLRTWCFISCTTLECYNLSTGKDTTLDESNSVNHAVVLKLVEGLEQKGHNQRHAESFLLV